MGVLQAVIQWVAGHWEALLLVAVGILELTILMRLPREKKERQELISALRSTRIVLGREPYLDVIKKTLRDSNTYIYFVSHTLTSNMSETKKDDVYRLYKKDVDHRCITGRDAGKIKYMWEQKRKGVQVRVNDFVMISTLRYQVCDDNVVVLGLAKEGDEESREGVLITDHDFSRILKDNFLTHWAESESLEDYTKRIALDTVKPNPALIEELSETWALNEVEKDELKGLLNVH